MGCEDSWSDTNTGEILHGDKNANVVCRMLGYGSAEAWFVQSNFKGTFGSAPSGDNFVLDDVKCTGTESSIFDCPHNEWDHNCSAREHTGVRCTPKPEVEVTDCSTDETACDSNTNDKTACFNDDCVAPVTVNDCANDDTACDDNTNGLTACVN